jgi:hypothetical protein
MNFFCHLKESDVSVQDVVKVDGRIDPVHAFVESFLHVADCSVGNDLVRELLHRGQVHALVELPHECVHSDDGKDQPEDQTDQLELKMNDLFCNLFSIVL